MNQQATTQGTTQTDRWAGLRERFLRHPLPIRLGELSSSLARAKYLADHKTPEKLALSFLREPALYLEWGFPDADSGLQTDLAELQQLIAYLRENWQAIWENPVERTAIGVSFDEWSQKMLDRSGLLNYDDWREVFKPAPASAPTSAVTRAKQ